MTVKDYISQKFQTFGINLSEADLLEISLSSMISGEDEITPSNIGLISVSMAEFIPSLLLRATSISENGFSMSWNIQGVKEYYSLNITLFCVRSTDLKTLCQINLKSDSYDICFTYITG